MQRRTFLCASLSTGPALITAAKGQLTLPRLGQGQHFYDASHDSLRPPPPMKFGNTHGIVVTGDGRIVLCHTVHKSSDSWSPPPERRASSWPPMRRASTPGAIFWWSNGWRSGE